MNEVERERYGRHFYEATQIIQSATNSQPWACQSVDAQQAYDRMAERFIAAASLVPLPEVRAIVKGHCSDVLARRTITGDEMGQVSACDTILALFDERYGEVSL